MDTYNIFSTTSTNVSGLKAKKLSLNVRNWFKIFKKTSMKLSSGHVGCGFGNPTENFWTEGHKLIAECRKQYEKFFSGKYSFKMFRWKRKILFWQPHRNFSSERPKRFCSLSWMDGKQYFSGKIHCLKLFLRTRRMQFWRACRNFFHIRPQTFHSRSKKDVRKRLKLFFTKIYSLKMFVLKKSVFIEMFWWTRKKLFWQSGRSFFGTKPKFIPSLCRNNGKE